MHTLQDARYAVRTLLKNPGFAAIAELTRRTRHRREYGHSMVASYLPARRATKVDPIVALRYE